MQQIHANRTVAWYLTRPPVAVPQPMFAQQGDRVALWLRRQQGHTRVHWSCLARKREKLQAVCITAAYVAAPAAVASWHGIYLLPG
jgi:hypothetical protein